MIRVSSAAALFSTQTFSTAILGLIYMAQLSNPHTSTLPSPSLKPTHDRPRQTSNDQMTDAYVLAVLARIKALDKSPFGRPYLRQNEIQPTRSCTAIILLLISAYQNQASIRAASPKVLLRARRFRAESSMLQQRPH